MAQINSREMVLLGLATATTNGTGPDLVVPMAYSSAILTLDVLTVSGTSPTLVVYWQDKLTLPAAADTSGLLPTGSAFYDDLLTFTTATTSTTRFVWRIGAGGNNVTAAAADGTLSVGTARNGPLGAVTRIKYIIAGTNPSFAFQVSAQFLP